VVKDFAIAVVPVGKIDSDELEAALSRVAKVVRGPVALRESLRVPPASEDTERRQHRAAKLIELLRAEVLKLAPGRLIGAEDPETKAPHKPDAYIFVTDADLFTARTDGALAALLRAKHSAVVSIRRLREAFYRRKADPVKQRSRLVKEILRMYGRLRGAKECADPQCVLAPSRVPADLDLKEERYCRACEQLLFEGRLQV